MAIPMNNVNIADVEKANAEQFANEVDTIENFVFASKWSTHDCGVEYLFMFNFAGRRYASDIITERYHFVPATEHMDAVISHIKGAGYCVYAEHYHNGYYGTYEVRGYYITKTPLSVSQRKAMHLQDEWSTPWGPGREQHKGERL